jgi:type IV pilus assembly protein PilE
MWHADSSCRQRPGRGFTLVELVVVILMVALLATLAYPSFHAQWLKARRGDGRVGLMQLQQAQERWRAEHPAYASASDLGTPAQSAHGHYRLGVLSASTTGYELQAVAHGPQRADEQCLVLRVRQAQGETTFLSGPTELTDNPDLANRGCWNR